jgi:23S rRNA (cytosine1962-C5)-methyltransferase
MLERGMMTEPNVVINSRGAERLEAGHLWIFRSDVSSAQAAAGDVVRVRDECGRFLGRAFYSDRSQITLRFLTRHDVAVDRAFFTERIRAAADWRNRVVEDTEAWRVVYGEGDLLPSLIVDRYGEYYVIQTLSQGSERRKAEIVEILVELFSPRGILERNDPKTRVNEGLEQNVSVLYGQVPKIVRAAVNGVRFHFDLYRGQKTGGFLDQRDNQRAALRYARGEALDCFSYHGGFALTLASRCQIVEAVDMSAAAVAAGRANLELNSTANVSFREGNVFDILKQYDESGRRFDTIVLDPPAFAKTRDAVPAAGRGYKEINLRSLKILRPGGILVTCSCSHHITESRFAEILLDASLDVNVMACVVERRNQSLDHPILFSVPETYYLKCFILRSL